VDKSQKYLPQNLNLNLLQITSNKIIKMFSRFSRSVVRSIQPISRKQPVFRTIASASRTTTTTTNTTKIFQRFNMKSISALFATAGGISFAAASTCTFVSCESSEKLKEVVNNIEKEHGTEKEDTTTADELVATSQEKDVTATWLSRIMASLIDGFIIHLLNIGTYAAVLLTIGPNEIMWYLVFLNYHGYNSMALVGGKGESGVFGQEGQTIGKKLLGIRTVLDDNGVHGDIHIGTYFLDFFGRLFIGIDFIWGIFDEKNRCLHNIIAGTRVIQVS
jgi:uncharacterized RDD family membrane protein YckC